MRMPRPRGREQWIQRDKVCHGLAVSFVQISVQAGVEQQSSGRANQRWRARPGFDVSLHASTAMSLSQGVASARGCAWTAVSQSGICLCGCHHQTRPLYSKPHSLFSPRRSAALLDGHALVLPFTLTRLVQREHGKMRTYPRLHVPVLLALGSAAAADQQPRAQELINPDGIAWPIPPSEPGNGPEAPQAPSPILINTNSVRPVGSASTLPPHFVASPAHAPVAPGPRPPGPIYTNTTAPPGPTVVTFTPPPQPTEITFYDLTNSSSSGNRSCTGCILAAQHPLTTWFDSSAFDNQWTSTVVTETVVTEFITYWNNNTIDTVVTEEHTVNQTKTVTAADDELITHTTPTFSVLVTDGVYLQFDAGPTYVIYNNIVGGPDEYIDRYFPEYDWTQQECAPTRTSLTGWQPAQTALQDWNYFVETHTTPLPNITKTPDAFPLPTQAVQYLGHEPAIYSQFFGLNLSECSLRPPSFSKSFELSHGINAPNAPAPTIPPQAAPPYMSPSTSTYLSTTYDTTSVHKTVRGCLRCLSDGEASVKVVQPTPAPGGDHDAHNFEPQPDEPAKPNAPGQPNEPGQPGQPGTPIGNGANPVNTPGPVQNEPGTSGQHDQDHQNLPPPVIIIGGQTLKPGETQTVGGVPVVRPVPSGDGETPRIIVGGSTYVYKPAQTPQPPILTVGGGTIAANPQGQFVFGTETLKPGGAPVIVNGNTVSLGPGGIAVVNGVTSTIPGLAAPAPTAAPPLVIGGQTVYATQVGGSATYVIAPAPAVGAGYWVVNDGTTAYVPAPGQTVTPDGTLTVSGTAYWRPNDVPGGIVVINGVTSTMGPGDVIVVNGATSTVASGAAITPAPALTINDLTYRQTVRDGTTEYVLGDGTTLVPGSTVEIDGTTYSLDQSGTALVINGQTSTIPNLPKSNSASVTSSSVASTTTAATTTTGRNAGDLIASGVGQTSKGAGASFQNAGIDKWVESFIIGAAGWLVMLL
ncbi:hypothetical protein yc1106_08457 [Curvularia clavata]|uniref:Uncharacterized protein n=1 Tax=Curvularia clavata TaxID=95742 RepID=A0A9Q8ZJC7_CURCL|nr:hypothetical protein yc1106_08457 [Curvularia clavata]